MSYPNSRVAKLRLAVTGRPFCYLLAIEVTGVVFIGRSIPAFLLVHPSAQRSGQLLFNSRLIHLIR